MSSEPWLLLQANANASILPGMFGGEKPEDSSK